VETVKEASRLGLTYVNLHWSSSRQLILEEDRHWIQGYFIPVVSFDGEPLWTLCQKSKLAKEEALKKHIEPHRGSIDDEQMTGAQEKAAKRGEKEGEAKRGEISKNYDAYRKKLKDELDAGRLPENEYKAALKELSAKIDAEVEQEKQRLAAYYQRNLPEDIMFDAWKESQFGQYVLKAGEISAYILVAYHMYENKDPLWVNIVGADVMPWDAYFKKHHQFNAAVACKYLEGHLAKKGQKGDKGPGRYNQEFLGGASVKDWLSQKKLYLLFEVPEISIEHAEGQYRLFDPRDGYWFVKILGSKYVKQTIDFEHLLSQKRNPDEVIRDMPSDGGSTVLLFHLGTPLPYGGGAHIPIPRGSKAQEQIYKWIYALKKKGFGDGFDGYMIYERGGGQTTLEVLRDSVQALRLIKTFLEKDVPPDELPEEFYGLSQQNEGEFKRQLVTVRNPDNAFAPLKGLIAVPEETYTFLGSQAVQKGKTEDWLKGRYR
jgi:hypothetical protein